MIGGAVGVGVGAADALGNDSGTAPGVAGTPLVPGATDGVGEGVGNGEYVGPGTGCDGGCCARARPMQRAAVTPKTPKAKALGNLDRFSVTDRGS